jgi:protein involved in ribonucleotide reduction
MKRARAADGATVLPAAGAEVAMAASAVPDAIKAVVATAANRMLLTGVTTTGTTVVPVSLLLGWL